MTLRRNLVRAACKIGNEVFESVSSIRDLGTTPDTRLTFSDHINDTVSQGAQDS